MRGLIAVLYIFALGWAFSHYEMDKLFREAARKAFRGLVAEGIAVSVELGAAPGEIHRIQPAVVLVPVVLPGGSHG